MPNTKVIPREQLASYFDAFSKRFLRDGFPEAVDVELLASDAGDQHVVEGARLIGITYDTRKNVLEFELDSGDHRVFEPLEAHVIEEQDGFPGTIQVIRADGIREIASVKRVGLRRIDPAMDVTRMWDLPRRD